MDANKENMPTVEKLPAVFSIEGLSHFVESALESDVELVNAAIAVSRSVTSYRSNEILVERAAGFLIGLAVGMVLQQRMEHGTGKAGVDKGREGRP